MRAKMLHSSFHLAHLTLFFSLPFLLQAPALDALPHSDPAPVQLLPATALAAASSAPPATIPAFPEQSDVAASSCPLDLPTDLLPSVSTACSSSSDADGDKELRHVSRSHCCPALAAWLYAAYSATALSARPLPASSASGTAGGYDLPALPDDSESCVSGVERALRDRGVALPRVNGTCDVAYCYCGIRLRRLTCAGAFVADTAEGRWAPTGDGGRRLERDCARPGLAGCTRCLRTLNQLKAKEKQHGVNDTTRKAAGSHDRECQLMGVTWLLSKNRTMYLPAATSVLRVLMAADAVGSSDPTSCLLSPDDIPLAVGSDQINGAEGSSTALLLSLLTFPFLLLLLSLESSSSCADK